MTMKPKTEGWFSEGMGAGRGHEEQKSGLHHDEIHEDLEGGGGPTVNDYGSKPVFATGDSPFHSGMGPGRGHTDS